MLANTKQLRRIFLGLLLALLTVLVYHGAWKGGFIWDDDDYVTKNALLTRQDGLSRIWFSLDAPSQYFPLTYTVLRIERSLWGLAPAGYHWVNIALHVGNALLLWWLLARLKVPGAYLAALIFALHPVQVESVAWITELKNVLMGFFFLLALLAWSAFVDENPKRRWRGGFYLAALLFYFLALSAKTTACTLPVALLLFLWLTKKPITKSRLGQISPFVLFGLVMGAVTIWWERYHQGTRGTLFVLNPIDRLLVASHAVWFYLGKLTWPVDLAFIYPQWKISAADPCAYLWFIACLAAAAAIFILRKRAGRGLEVAALFFVTTLGPVLGFIMLYTFRYTYVADHYQYLASIGPIALVAAGLAQLTRRGALLRALGAGAAGSIIFLLSILTWRQSATYRDVETLWRSTLMKNPDCWMAYNNLGIELAKRGEFDDAIAQYQRSIALQANYAQAHYNLGTALLERGEVDRAIAECRTSLNLQPNDPDGQVALGNALLGAGRVDESIVHYSRALALQPEDADAHYNLGNALQMNGNIVSATDHYRRALEIAPGIMEAHLNLGNLFFQQKREREAIGQYREALGLSPRSVKVLNNLAWALVSASDPSLHDGRRAVELAEQANSAAGDSDALVLYTLGAAYAEVGRFEKAAETARHALEMAKGQGNSGLVGEIQRTLERYEKGRAYEKP